MDFKGERTVENQCCNMDVVYTVGIRSADCDPCIGVGGMLEQDSTSESIVDGGEMNLR